MDPNVYRSTSHPVYHGETDLVSPRYLATDASRSLRHGDHFREPLPGRHYADFQLGQNYLSDRRIADQHNTHDIDSLVRKYATLGRRDRGLLLTTPGSTTT
jgi:hypothetical protein